MGGFKSCSRICWEKRETRNQTYCVVRVCKRIEKENLKLGESQNLIKAQEGRFENQEENLNMWVGQTGTGQNLGGRSRFKGAAA